MNGRSSGIGTPFRHWDAKPAASVERFAGIVLQQSSSGDLSRRRRCPEGALGHYPVDRRRGEVFQQGGDGRRDRAAQIQIGAAGPF